MVSKKKVSCEGRIEKFVPRDHRLSPLGKLHDAKWRSSGWIFLSYPHSHDGFLYSSPLYQNEINVDSILGGIRRNETGKITGAGATTMLWLLERNKTVSC